MSALKNDKIFKSPFFDQRNCRSIRRGWIDHFYYGEPVQWFSQAGNVFALFPFKLDLHAFRFRCMGHRVYYAGFSNAVAKFKIDSDCFAKTEPYNDIQLRRKILLTIGKMA